MPSTPLRAAAPRPLHRLLPEVLVVPLVVTIVAMGGRAAVGGLMDDTAPFLFALPAVALVALRLGARCAAAVAVLCAAWAAAPWVPPRVAPASVAAFLATAVALAWAVPRLAGGTRRPDADGGRRTGADASARHRVIDTLRWVVLLAALLPAVALVALGAWRLNERTADVYAQLERAARVAAEHAARVYETNEMLLRRVFDAIGEDDDARIALREPVLHRRLKAMTADLPQVQSVWVWDAAGRPILNSRFMPAPREIDVSDREYFRWHRDHPGGGMFITEALVARATGEVFSDLSLRRETPDGRFAGVVTVGLHVRYLEAFHAEVARDLTGASLSVLREDGRWIARHPGPVPVGATLAADHVLMRGIAAGRQAGRLEASSSVDGAQRIAAYRRVAGYPVYVVAAIGRAELVAGWRADMARVALIAVPLVVGMVLLAWLALRRAEEGLGAMERLQAESAQRLRVEAALRQSQKLEALGRLTGGVAHDFNNLLTVVANNAHLLRRAGGLPADSAQLAAIDRAVRTGTQLTRQLLAFSRRQVVRVERIRLQEQMPDLTLLVRPLLGPGTALEVDVAPDTAPIDVDRAEFELAILNLVTNARDAMPEGGRVQVTARNGRDDERAADGGPAVVVEVEDCGQGIAPELHERIFEPFFSTKPRGEGTGLGLPQVQELCRRAGGSVRLRSAPGQGTTIALLFPAAPDQPDPVRAEAAAPPPSLSLRVLLVEDNAEVALATRELLEAMGCTVRWVDDVDAAIDALTQAGASPDVVLSDVAMPGSRDGIGLGGWIREHRPAIGVVLMTGYAEHLGKAAEQGLSVLPKPCAPAALAQALWDAHRAATRPDR